MKKLLSLALALTAGAGLMKAQGTIEAGDLTLYQGSEAELRVSIDLPTDHQYVSYQFEVELPQGVSLVADEYGNAACTLGEGQPAGVFTVDFPVSSAILKVWSSPSTIIDAHDGVLVTIPVVADNDLAAGEKLTGRLSGVVFTTMGNLSVDLPDATFGIDIATDMVIIDETQTRMPVATDENVKVLVRRGIEAETWTTIVLPFDMTGQQVTQAFGGDVELADFIGWQVTAKDEDEQPIAINLDFKSQSPDNGIEANRPYLIKVSDAITEFRADDVAVAPVATPNKTVGRGNTQGRFIGTYVAGTTVPDEKLYMEGGDFWYSHGEATLLAMRAYFDLRTVLLGYDDDARASISVTIDGVEVIVGIEPVVAGRDVVPADGVFDLQGRRVASPVRGIYIVGGRKVVVK